MEKIDFKKRHKALYLPSAARVVEIDVPSMNFLMVDGEGDPNESQAYREAVDALFAVSYAIKFMVRKSPLAIDYGVMPLEGLWWADDMTTFSVEDKSGWKWTMMIMQPDIAARDIVEAAIAETRKKKNPPALSKLRPEPFHEGRCAQILHVGPFSEEGPTIEKLHCFIDANGARRGKHHEIYLSDIRKADPAKWKTIVRHPMVEK